MKIEEVSATWSSPQFVIPAHAGIQVCSPAQLAWIPAFAGMTDPGGPLRSHPQRGIFEGGHEEHEVKKFRNSNVRNRRVLRVLRGEIVFAIGQVRLTRQKICASCAKFEL